MYTQRARLDSVYSLIEMVKNHSLYNVQYKSMADPALKSLPTPPGHLIALQLLMRSKRQFRDEIHNLSKKDV